MFEVQKKFVENFDMILFEVFRKSIHEERLVLKDYIIERQLFDKGIDGNKVSLGGYSRTTIRMKLALGQPADRVTLKDTGEFHAKIEISAFLDYFEVSSNVTHDKFIFAQYNKDVLKISDDNMMEFAMKSFIPNLKKEINDQFAK